MSARPLPSTEILLAQAGWVRELAASLVTDPNLVDDVVQDTLTVALERPPDTDRPVRAWLGTVVRNLVRQRYRSGARRIDRETLAARDDRVPSPLEALDRLSVHRELVEAVTELDEPYRTAVLLRYFEGRPPREIASALGVPVKTVKTRLSRGLARLRRRLEEHHGDREWLAALAPLVSLRRPAKAAAFASSSLGALAVNAPVKLSLAAVLVAGALAGAWMIGEPRAGAVPSTVGRAPTRETRLQEDVRPGSEGETVEVEGRAAVEEAPVPTRELSVAPAVAPAAPREVTIRVVDVDGGPLGGVELAFRDGKELVPIDDEHGVTLRSAPSGLVRTVLGRGSATATVMDERWATLFDALVGRSTAEPLVVVAQALSWGGRVLDSDGRPIPDARVAFVRPKSFDASFPLSLESAQLRGWRGATDDDGTWVLTRVPLVPGAQLHVTADGFTSVQVDAPQYSTDALDIVLTRHVAAGGSITGHVVDASGKSVEGARVALGAFATVTDDGGAFAIDLSLTGSTARIVAVHESHLPAVRDEPAEGWGPYVLLELTGTPLQLAGRVVDDEGKPVAGAQVWIVDPTAFGLIGGRPAQLESLLAGVAADTGGGPPAEVVARWIERGAYLDDKGFQSTPNVTWSWVETDSDGRFSLRGLTDRPYRVGVFDPDTLLVVESDPVQPGGAPIVVTVPAADLLPRVSGRVVREDGAPMPGLDVWLKIAPFQNRVELGAAVLQTIALRPGPRTTTDEDGRFELKKVPRRYLEVEVSGDGILPLETALDEDTDFDDLELRVESKCHVEVALSEEPERADAASFLDAAGDPLEVFLLQGNSINVFDSARLIDGRSGLISVSSRAARLVLLLDGEPVEQHPIQVVPGQRTTLDF